MGPGTGMDTASVRKSHVIKTYGRVESKLHAFLISALDETEWSGS
jgi:hypothetical protein